MSICLSAYKRTVRESLFKLNNFTPGPQHYETTTNVDELETEEEPRPLQTAPRFVGMYWGSRIRVFNPEDALVRNEIINYFRKETRCPSSNKILAFKIWR